MPVAGVGSINNTFGIKGVSEHTFFFKSITDAAKLRRQVGLLRTLGRNKTFLFAEAASSWTWFVRLKCSALMQGTAHIQ